MTHSDREALLDEIVRSDDAEHLAQLQHVITQEHAGDPALGTLLEWIAARRQMLERERTRDPAEAFARPYRRAPMSAEMFEGYVGRIRGAATEAELWTLLRSLQSAYGLDVRWGELVEAGQERRGRIEARSEGRDEKQMVEETFRMLGPHDRHSIEPTSTRNDWDTSRST